MYKKYIYRIFKVLLFWNIFYATVVQYLVNAFGAQYNYSFHTLIDIFNDTLYGKFHMWYLYMCIGLYIITPLLRPITKNKEALEYFIITFLLIVQILPFIFSLFNNIFSTHKANIFSEVLAKLMIFMVAGFSGYYVIGHYLSTIEIKNKSTLTTIYTVGFISLILTYILKIVFSIVKQKDFLDYGDYNSLNVSITAISIFIFFKYNSNVMSFRF